MWHYTHDILEMPLPARCLPKVVVVQKLTGVPSYSLFQPLGSGACVTDAAAHLGLPHILIDGTLPHLTRKTKFKVRIDVVWPREFKYPRLDVSGSNSSAYSPCRFYRMRHSPVVQLLSFLRFPLRWLAL